jgi:hypothetical protein
MFQDHPGAARLLADNLPAHFTRPATITDHQLPEWAVRRLFDLDLDELIHAVVLLKDNLSIETAKAVFDHVACCLPVDDGPAWWVASEAAEDLHREAQLQHPRIVRVCTDEQLTVGVLMRRAFQDQPWSVLPVGGPSSALAGDAGLPAELLDDIRAEIRRLGGATQEDWATNEQRRTKATARLRRTNLFFGLRVDANPDAAHLRDLAGLFPGLLFLIRRRALTLPNTIDDVLLDLVPPIDPDSEWSGVSGRNLLIQSLGTAS